MWGWRKFCSTKKGSQNRFWCHVMQLNFAQARNFSAHFNPNQLKEARKKCANQNTKFYHNASANIHQVNSSWHLYPHQKVVWARTAFIPTPFHKKKKPVQTFKKQILLFSWNPDAAINVRKSGVHIN